MAQIAIAETHEDQTGRERTWERFACQVQDACAAAPDADVAMGELLQPSMHQLYNSIVEDPEFRDQFLTCPDSVGRGSPTWSSVLFRDNRINAGLLAVYRDKPIPLHDHPDTAGVILVLSGAVRILYADLTSHRDNSSLVELQITRITERLPGQVSWFYANSRNIHHVEAETATAIMLVVHMPNIATDRQHAYFPVQSYEPVEGNKFLAHRIKLKRGKPDSNNIE